MLPAHAALQWVESKECERITTGGNLLNGYACMLELTFASLLGPARYTSTGRQAPNSLSLHCCTHHRPPKREKSTTVGLTTDRVPLAGSCRTRHGQGWAALQKHCFAAAPAAYGSPAAATHNMPLHPRPPIHAPGTNPTPPPHRHPPTDHNSRSQRQPCTVPRTCCTSMEYIMAGVPSNWLTRRTERSDAEQPIWSSEVWSRYTSTSPCAKGGGRE